MQKQKGDQDNRVAMQDERERVTIGKGGALQYCDVAS